MTAGRPTVMTDKNPVVGPNKAEIESAREEVLDYFINTGVVYSRKAHKSEVSEVCSFTPKCDLRHETLKKQVFLILRKKFNKKIKCLCCTMVVSSEFCDYRARHCVKCEAEFKELGKLKKYVTTRKRKERLRRTDDGSINAKELKRLLDEQGSECNYCMVKLTQKNKQLDHIYPVSKGGAHAIGNVQYLCQPCNSTKYNKVVNA